MSVVYHKGEFHHAQSLDISFNNRAFRYADGFFEAVRFYNRKPIFWSYHLARIEQTCAFLKLEECPSSEMLTDLVNNLLMKNDVDTGTLRIVFYRSGGGKYFPESNMAEIFMEVSGSGLEVYPSPVVTKKAVIFEDRKSSGNPFGNYKLIDKTLHILAAVHALENQVSEAILLNEAGYITEAVSSNVFFVSGTDLVTPPLIDGGLNGVIRRVIIEKAHQFNMNLKEESVLPSQLSNFQEVFTTNTGSGIASISSIGDKVYKSERAEQMQSVLTTLAINSCSDFLGSQP